MDKQRQDDQVEPTYNNSVPIQNVALKKQWTIQKGGRRGLGICVLTVKHAAADDDEVSGAIWGQKRHPPLGLGVIAFEKRAFPSPSTMVGQRHIIISIRQEYC